MAGEAYPRNLELATGEFFHLGNQRSSRRSKRGPSMTLVPPDSQPECENFQILDEDCALRRS